ncbi:carboxy-S-adenosyl-L-methionine synthase CmoA [Luteolibacter soli]|uniref:Carboxy-S-adenosyl-L-methionine synthase n=1 Tax=Luteolibacter soli TaxID=3135280 RepID=A0ABU9B231_9BACT
MTPESPSSASITSFPGPEGAAPAREKLDQVFAKEGSGSADFTFNSETAAVFDDMVDRSVPYYSEIQRMCCELAADFATPGSNLYDLGVSTATTFLALDGKVDPSTHFIGVDNSAPMLAEAAAKIKRSGTTRPIQLIQGDLHETPVIENASVVMLILTLQFIRPLYRERMIQRIYDGLNKNGCLILVEKVTTENTVLNRLFIKNYYDMKRRVGYSDIEISQKREALENVLIPYRPEENETLLKQSGFHCVEEFFRWYNFTGVIALK